MKKLILCLVFILTYSFIHSQSSAKKSVNIDRKKLIKEYLQLDPTDERKFWNVYDEYYDKMKKNNDERFERFDAYVETDSIPERELRKMVKVNSYVKQLDAMLLEQYYEILRKRISSDVAGKFYHFENAINCIALAERYKQWEAIPPLD